MAVLVIIGLLVAQITGAISRATRWSNRSIDAASQARMTFDRIGIDLAALARRRDIDFYAGNGNSLSEYYAAYDTSNLLLFVSSIGSAGITSASRKVSVVAYRMAAHPDNKGPDGVARTSLLRAGIPIAWNADGGNDSGFMGLKSNGLPVRFSDPAFPGSLLPVAPTASAGNSFDVLAPGIIKAIVGFQLYPDNQPVTLAGSSLSFGNAQGQIVYNPPLRVVTGADHSTTATYIDLNRISGIVVGLVAIDTSSLKLLKESDIGTLGRQFPTPSDASNLLPVQAWASPAEGLARSLSGQVPLPVLQSIRVFQQSFPITPFPSTQE